MQPGLYRNHYKVLPEWKDRLIFFLVGGFYKTFESDATVCSYLFGFKISISGGMRTVGFPSTSGDKYFNLLKENGYSYAVFQSNNEGHNMLFYNVGNKPLEIMVSISTYAGLLNDLKELVGKYESALRIMQPIDIPIGDMGIIPKEEVFTPIDFPGENKTIQIGNEIPPIG